MSLAEAPRTIEVQLPVLNGDVALVAGATVVSAELTVAANVNSAMSEMDHSASPADSKESVAEAPRTLSWREMSPQQRLEAGVARYGTNQLSPSEVRARNARRVVRGDEPASAFKRAAGHYPPDFRR